VEGADLLAHEKARADRPSADIRDERRLVAVAAEQIEEPGDVLVQRALAVGEESCVPQPRGGRHIGGGEPAHKGPGIEIHVEASTDQKQTAGFSPGGCCRSKRWPINTDRRCPTCSRAP
jgi:hypothetical protein